MSEEFWNERYGAAEYAYGQAPNDFLFEVVGRLPRGPALCLGAGEGRNAVFLARHLGPVTAVDMSVEGMDKAARLAEAAGVELETIVADLNEHALGTGWAVITSIWAHTPSSVRRRVHAEVLGALAPGGVFVLEAYTPDQVGRGTGGPPNPDVLPTLAELEEQFTGFDLVIAREMQREVHEGRYHHGVSAVVQLLAKKPGPPVASRRP